MYCKPQIVVYIDRDCSLCPVARMQRSDCNGIKDAWIRACRILESYLVRNFYTQGKCQVQMLIEKLEFHYLIPSF